MNGKIMCHKCRTSRAVGLFLVQSYCGKWSQQMSLCLEHFIYYDQDGYIVKLLKNYSKEDDKNEDQVITA